MPCNHLHTLISLYTFELVMLQYGLGEQEKHESLMKS